MPNPDNSAGGKYINAGQAYMYAVAAGANGMEAAMLAAIAGAESGYYTRAYNPHGRDLSYGLWQINMLGDMGRARRQQFGISNNAQLYDPLTNARAALMIYRQQGWKAWSVYSNGSYKRFMPQVQAAIAQGGGGGAPAGGGGIPAGGGDAGASPGGTPMAFTADAAAPAGPPKLKAHATEAEIVKFIEDNYGPEQVAMLRVPELRKMLIRSAQEGYVGDRFDLEFKKTKWFQSRTPTMRRFDMLYLTDPKALVREINQKKAELAPVWADYGVDISLDEMALQAVRLGLTDAELMPKIATALEKESAATGLDQGTKTDVSADQLMSIARDEYLMEMDRQTAERWAVKAIRTGQPVEDAWRGMLHQLSAARFGIDPNADVAPADVMAPVKTAVAEALEIAPESVDLLSPEYKALMQIETSEGKFRPMTAAEAAKWARSQDRYTYTQQAQDQAAQVGEGLAKAFGKVG